MIPVTDLFDFYSNNILMPKIFLDKSYFRSEKGIIHLALPFLFLIILGIVAFLLMKNLPALKSSKQEPTVSLQTGYKNPFDKGSQYVNPFSAYKNPFDSI